MSSSESKQQQKQAYLIQEIVKGGYDQEEFIEFMTSKKKNGELIESWTMAELISVFLLFIIPTIINNQLCNKFKESHQPEEENCMNESEESETESTKNQQEQQQEQQKHQESQMQSQQLKEQYQSQIIQQVKPAQQQEQPKKTQQLSQSQLISEQRPQSLRQQNNLKESIEVKSDENLHKKDNNSKSSNSRNEIKETNSLKQSANLEVKSQLEKPMPQMVQTVKQNEFPQQRYSMLPATTNTQANNIYPNNSQTPNIQVSNIQKTNIQEQQKTLPTMDEILSSMIQNKEKVQTPLASNQQTIQFNVSPQKQNSSGIYGGQNQNQMMPSLPFNQTSKEMPQQPQQPNNQLFHQYYSIPPNPFQATSISPRPTLPQQQQLTNKIQKREPSSRLSQYTGQPSYQSSQTVKLNSQTNQKTASPLISNKGSTLYYSQQPQNQKQQHQQFDEQKHPKKESKQSQSQIAAHQQLPQQKYQPISQFGIANPQNKTNQQKMEQQQQTDKLASCIINFQDFGNLEEIFPSPERPSQKVQKTLSQENKQDDPFADFSQISQQKKTNEKNVNKNMLEQFENFGFIETEKPEPRAKSVRVETKEKQQNEESKSIPQKQPQDLKKSLQLPIKEESNTTWESNLNEGEELWKKVIPITQQKDPLSEKKFSKIEIIVNEPQEMKGGILTLRRTYLSYKIQTKPFDWTANRRFIDFVWLREILSKKYPANYLPPLVKKKSGKREKYEIQKRMYFLKVFCFQLTHYKIEIFD